MSFYAFREPNQNRHLFILQVHPIVRHSMCVPMFFSIKRKIDARAITVQIDSQTKYFSVFYAFITISCDLRAHCSRFLISFRLFVSLLFLALLFNQSRRCSAEQMQMHAQKKYSQMLN